MKKPRLNTPRGWRKAPIASIATGAAAIEAAVADGVAVVLAGKLEGNNLLDAGISAMPKAPNLAATDVAA